MTRRKPLIDEAHGVRRETLARWILVALVVSIVLHGIGFNLARNVPVESMSDSFYERIVPRSFHVERVDIDPRLLEPAPAQTAAPAKVVPISLPDEEISTLETPEAAVSESVPPTLDAALLDEKPALPDAVAVPESSNLLERADEALKRELLKEMNEAFATTPSVPLSNVPNSAAAQGVGARSGGGFSDLDKLLQGTGPLQDDTAPILLPGDVLFEYDQYELQPRALESLEKLARILSRNPRARFVIEGHSDSYGPPDYNMRLSELRAESVKKWLVGRMGIDDSRVKTRGLGQTRLVVPPTESVEGQMLNRRVEIVIQNNVQ